MLITATINSFGPKMKDGVHETYNGKNGLLYLFAMTITYSQNGQTVTETGDVNSNKQQPSWKIGPKYTMEREVRGQSGQFIHYSKLTNTEAPAGGAGGGSYQANPALKLAFARQKAVECAFTAATGLFKGQKLEKIEHFNLVASLFARWIQEVETEQEIWLNIAALNTVAEIASLMVIQNNEGEKMVDAWIRTAVAQREVFTNLIRK